jgi:hypothetical protein
MNRGAHAKCSSRRRSSAASRDRARQLALKADRWALKAAFERLRARAILAAPPGCALRPSAVAALTMGAVRADSRRRRRPPHGTRIRWDCRCSVPDEPTCHEMQVRRPFDVDRTSHRSDLPERRLTGQS